MVCLNYIYNLGQLHGYSAVPSLTIELCTVWLTCGAAEMQFWTTDSCHISWQQPWGSHPFGKKKRSLTLCKFQSSCLLQNFISLQLNLAQIELRLTIIIIRHSHWRTFRREVFTVTSQKNLFWNSNHGRKHELIMTARGCKETVESFYNYKSRLPQCFSKHHLWLWFAAWRKMKSNSFSQKAIKIQTLRFVSNVCRKRRL